LGDSIFDNGVYVPGEPSLIRQLRSRLPNPWRATLLAVDGAVIDDLSEQLRRLPPDATHLVVSVGGNDALGDAHLLENVRSPDQFQTELAVATSRFRAAYASMLDQVLRYRLPTAVCTIYDQCPIPDPTWRQLIPMALAAYDGCIIDEATRRSIAVIELREICTEPEDYSALSPIEPSARGGEKIVEAILAMLPRG
jgi:hypothetical protein